MTLYDYNSNFDGITTDSLFATREENFEMYEKLREETIEYLKLLLDEVIPDYCVGNLYDNTCTLKPKKEGTRNLSFEIYFGQHIIREDELEFKINPATIGSFTIDKDTEERRYYIAIGTLLSNTKIHSKLRDTLLNFHFEIKSIKESCYAINGELRKREQIAIKEQAEKKEQEYFEKEILPTFNGNIENMWVCVEKKPVDGYSNAMCCRTPVKVLSKTMTVLEAQKFMRDYKYSHRKGNYSVVLANKIKFKK
jgi:hypothetical protein